MKILWDEVKRQANLEKHGFDFADIGEFDWRDAVIEPARLDTGGRRRLKAVGYFREVPAIVIFALLGTEAISIVSFRHASVKEREGLKWLKH